MRDNAKDTLGKPYATTASTRAGDFVVTDAGFDCLAANTRHKVEADADGLFVRCADGQHYLEGQLSDDETAYVGLYPSRPAESL